MFCKVLNNRLVQHFDKGGALHEGQAGFRLMTFGKGSVEGSWKSGEQDLPRVYIKVYILGD